MSMMTQLEGPAGSAPDERDYQMRRIGPRRVTGAQIVELFENNRDAGWQENYWTKIDNSLHHLMGGTRFILPDAFLKDVEGRERMIVVFPQKMTIPLKIINMIGNKRPKAMRYAVGMGLRSDNQSTDVETWLNAVLEFDADGRPLVNYREMVGRQLLEGAIVVKAISSDAHWRKSPSWLDVVDEEEWLDMSPRKQRRYASEDDVLMQEEEEDENELTWSSDAARRRSERPKRYMRVDKEGTPVPKSAYHRDTKGRTKRDGYYQDEKGKPKKNSDGTPREWEEDRNSTLRAYRKDQKEWLAQRLPFEVEIISARHCIPLMDDNERVEAIIICRQYEAEDLIGKDFVWGNDEAALIPAPDIGSVLVYELWHTDERDRPYVAYFVDGYEYTMLRQRRMETAAESDDDGDAGGRLADAVIDLQREYGCTRLPVGWFWGLHWPIDDVTKKAVPFLDPVLSSINAAEGLATATHVYAWRNAFAGSMIEIRPELLERYGDYYLKNADIFTFSLGPMENAVVPGTPQIQAAPAPGAGVQQLLQVLLQASAAMSPSDAVFGGAGASSGHDRALSKEYLEVALSQVLEGARAAVKFIAELILEYAVWIAEKTGRPVPVYANTPITQAKLGPNGKPKPSNDIVELMPSWLKSNTRIHTYFEADDTDELTRNQLASQHMQGLVPWDQFRTEAWNDPNPEVTLAKIFGDQAIRTPEGRAEIMAFAKELRSDEQDQEKQKLIDEGLLSEDGVPTEARVAFTPRRLRKQQEQEAAGQMDLMSLIQQQGQAPAVIGPNGGPPPPQLPPGVGPPPGIPPELAARHLQLNQSHDFANALGAPSGPLGPIGGPANGQSIPAPGTGPGGPQGPVAPQPPRMPAGVEGPADINAFPKQFAAAPSLPGMSFGSVGPDSTDQALGGVIAGLLRAGAKNYHAKRRGPRAPGTGRRNAK
jgi:hypothetical protein